MKIRRYTLNQILLKLGAETKSSSFDEMYRDNCYK